MVADGSIFMTLQRNPEVWGRSSGTDKKGKKCIQENEGRKLNGSLRDAVDVLSFF